MIMVKASLGWRKLLVHVFIWCFFFLVSCMTKEALSFQRTTWISFCFLLSLILPHRWKCIIQWRYNLLDISGPCGPVLLFSSSDWSLSQVHPSLMLPCPKTISVSSRGGYSFRSLRLCEFVCMRARLTGWETLQSSFPPGSLPSRDSTLWPFNGITGWGVKKSWKISGH